ncbi:Uncharacterised protein [Actinomyces bovis]|uniref:Uncharacterized protein n=1 Tax=Actinomyces bovis TaxID=1658 RepID=A0ABY1VKP6_9ACTO|nr:Uncharacterised protein [Actinomyces bovis]VEG54171.1 Uncharacterised protein [Actinomyces israelii]
MVGPLQALVGERLIRDLLEKLAPANAGIWTRMEFSALD